MIKIDILSKLNYGSIGETKRINKNLIQKIPDAVILHLFEFLDSKSVSRIAATCKNFSELAKDPTYLPLRRLNVLKESEDSLLLFLHKKQQVGICSILSGSVVAAYDAERSYMQATSHLSARRLEVSILCNEVFLSRKELIDSSWKTYGKRKCLIITLSSIAFIWMILNLALSAYNYRNYDRVQL